MRPRSKKYKRTTSAQRRKDQSPPSKTLNAHTQACNRKAMFPMRFPRIHVRCTDCPTKDVQLTVSIEFDRSPPFVNPYRQRDTEFQYDEHQSIGTDVPTYWMGSHGVANGVVPMTPPSFLLGYFEPPGNYWSPNQLHPSGVNTYSPGVPNQLSQGHEGFPPAVGGNVDPAAPASYDGISALGGTGLGYGNPSSLTRCDTSMGGPTHLTTNISMAAYLVSFQYVAIQFGDTLVLT